MRFFFGAHLYPKEGSKMKKRFLTMTLVIIHCSMLIFIACNITEDSSLNQPQKKLEIPANLRFVGTVAYWDSVSNSSGYVLSVNGNTYEVNATQYEFSTLPEVVSGLTYIVMIKSKGNGNTFFDSDFSNPQYYIYFKNDSPPIVSVPQIDTSLTLSTKRYDIIAAPQPNDLPIIIHSITDGVYNYYLLDIGYVKNVPISSGDTVKYTGQIPLTVSFTKSTTTTKTIETAVSKTFSESIQESHMNELGGKFGVETSGIAKLWGAKFSVEVNYSRTWGTVTDNTNSITSTYTTAESIANSLENSISFTVGEHGEAVGFYRLSLFSICDIYFLLKTNIDNSQLVECTAIMCARSNNYFAIDYDVESGGDFKKTSTSKEIVFTENYYKKLPPPSNDKIAKPQGPGGSDYDTLELHKMTNYYDLN